MMAERRMAPNAERVALAQNVGNKLSADLRLD